MNIDERELSADMQMLCTTIGERLAGSRSERRAAAYIVRRMRTAGLQNVRELSFPCISLRRAKAEVYELKGKAWQSVDAMPIVGAPSTPGGASVEGELVWLFSPEGLHRLQRDSFRGAIVAIFGPMPVSEAAHCRLIAASPAAIVHIDDRFPFWSLKSDGSYPYWNQLYRMPPTVSVPYMDAWRWRQHNVKRLRVKVQVTHRRARSANVVGEIAGSEKMRPAIVITSHLDTQAGNCGADDNASGVAAMLALARQMSNHSGRRTIRFIAFGAEEQLSVGATHYVRRNRITQANTGLILNLDSTASLLGHYYLWTAGDDRLARYATKSLASHGIDATAKHEITPFVDCFPFNRKGIPSLWCRRINFPGGRWQHHSQHDTLENISIPQLIALLRAVGPLVRNLADREKWPFCTTLSSTQRSAARRLSRTLLGW